MYRCFWRRMISPPYKYSSVDISAFVFIFLFIFLLLSSFYSFLSISIPRRLPFGASCVVRVLRIILLFRARWRLSRNNKRIYFSFYHTVFLFSPLSFRLCLFSFRHQDPLGICGVVGYATGKKVYPPVTMREFEVERQLAKAGSSVVESNNDIGSRNPTRLLPRSRIETSIVIVARRSKSILFAHSAGNKAATAESI